MLLAGNGRSWLIAALGLNDTSARQLTNADLERQFLQANSGLAANLSNADHYQGFLTNQGVAAGGSLANRMKTWLDTRNSLVSGSIQDALRKTYADVAWAVGPASNIPIPTANLLAFWDARNLTGTNDNPGTGSITQWRDSSGNGNTLTTNNFFPDSARSILVFGGTGGFCSGLLGGLNANVSIYAVAARGQAGGMTLAGEENVTVIGWNASECLTLSQSTNGTSYAFTTAGTTPTSPTNTTDVLVAIGGTTPKVYRNSTEVTPATAGTIPGALGNNSNNFMVGYTTGNYFYIRALAVYSVAHDATTRGNIVSALNTTFIA